MDDIFSLQDISKNPDIVAFSELANLHYQTINSPPKFTETVFLDSVEYKGTRFNEKAILDVKTHFKQTKEKPLALNNVWEKYF